MACVEYDENIDEDNTEDDEEEEVINIPMFQKKMISQCSICV